MKILVIEDDKSVRDEMVELLNNASYEVRLIEDFNDTLGQILSINPDLVLLDINIPFMNGEMLLEKLRKVSNVPVIMVTSRNTLSDEVLSMGYGADDYVTKPYNRDELMTDLWDNNEYINDNALTVNISRLRSKLEELGLRDVIETRKGQGYILL